MDPENRKFGRAIVAIVIDKLPKQFVSTTNGNQKINDFIVVDEKLKPIILTTWGGFVDKEGIQITEEIEAGNYPVISLDYIAVVHFKDISLSTKTHSTIMVEPKIPRAEQLKEWAKEHRETLDALKRLRDYNNAAISLANPETEEISKIATVPALIKPPQPAWIKGKISINLDNKSTWYIGCSHCLKKVYAENDQLFNCMHCGEKTAVGTPRCKMDVEIVDDTAHITASVFGLPAETLLLHSSKQVMQLEQEGKKLPLSNINNRLKDQEFIVQLRTQSFTQQGKFTTSYTIISLHDASLYAITSKRIEHDTLPIQKKRICIEDEDNDNATQKRIKKI